MDPILQLRWRSTGAMKPHCFGTLLLSVDVIQIILVTTIYFLLMSYKHHCFGTLLLSVAAIQIMFVTVLLSG